MPPPSSAAAAPLVLVVDDVDVYRELARMNLEAIGWQVEECEDGVAALQWLQAHGVPRAMLVDINMPRMNGDEVARQVRALHGPSVRMVAHTSHCLPEDLQGLKTAGFDEVLTKPASQNDMARALPLALAR